MRGNSSPQSQSLARLSQLDVAAVLLFAVISAIYFVQAIALASRAPLWMDEILTVWTARQPNVTAVWAALLHGAEFTPPLYDEFIHALQHAGINSPLGLRLPSIAAIYIAALATGIIVRGHAGIALAAMAAGAVLSGGLFTYAVQARPYALVTAAFTCALAVYDRCKVSSVRLTVVALLLGLAIGLHFYALLLAGALGLLELVKARAEGRAPSWPMLAAIALAACSILLWSPLLIAARTYSGADVSAPGYYAKPTLLALPQTYGMLIGALIVPIAGMAAALIAGKQPVGGHRAGSMLLTGSIVTAVPVGVFVFALLVSHSYSDRYGLVGAVGIALLLSSVLQMARPRTQPVAVLMLALMIASTAWRSGGEIAKTDRLEALSTANATGTLPIVTGSGLRFFEIRENQTTGKRLVFLDTPGMPSRDPTNRNQVMRWKAIDPSLPVENAETFLCATPDFYLFAQPHGGGSDSLPAWLAARADFEPLPVGRPSLTLVHARPCANGSER